jgi:Tfp pilus assembly protein PilF
MSHRRALVAGLVVVASAAQPLAAQGPPLLHTPDLSPRATVSQTVGLTEISMDYGRPAVNGRKVWGALVPFDTVWRAGANINTILSVSSPFSAGGTGLPAGKYGIHMIPSSTTWTIILSRQAGAWGSFSYDPKEDAARLMVTPRPADFVERLQYTLDEPTDSSVTLTLRWEKLAVPLAISVNTTDVVLDSLRQQFRNLPRFFPAAWVEGARWALQHGRVDAAEAWADSSINVGPTFAALMLKANIRERRGDAATAQMLRQQALLNASEAEVNAYGYQLLAQKRVDDAIAIFQKNVKDHPGSWNVYDSLGEALAVKGDRRQARVNYQKALAMAPEGQRARIQGVIAGLTP